ncbi:MAG: cytochrome P450 [Cyanobacteria bacterium P01_A01_bin.40]
MWKTVKHLQQKLDFLIYAEITWRRKQSDNSRFDLLSLLIISSDENGQSMTDKEIRDAIMTLIFAGFETAAAALSWMLYWVHYIPEVSSKTIE